MDRLLARFWAVPLLLLAWQCGEGPTLMWPDVDTDVSRGDHLRETRPVPSGSEAGGTEDRGKPPADLRVRVARVRDRQAKR
jgi:hypothetical protein